MTTHCCGHLAGGAGVICLLPGTQKYNTVRLITVMGAEKMARVVLGNGDTSQEYANDMFNLQIGSLLNGVIDQDWATSTYVYIFYPPYPAPGDEPESYFALGGFGFTYSGNSLVGGTVTEAGEAEDGQLVYRITGLSLSAAQVYQWIASGNSTALLNAVLAGDDEILGSANRDRLVGLTGADTLYGYAGNDWLEGGAGNDRLYGGAGNDLLYGGAGDDYFTSTAGNLDSGNDLYDGGDGIDGVDYSNSTSAVFVDLQAGSATDGLGGTDTLVRVERVFGSLYSDTLHGDAQNNRLSAGAGDDLLGGGGGDDELFGGQGVDTATYARATSGVDVDLQLTGSQDTLGAGRDLLNSIENLIGTNHVDSLVGDSGANRLQGGQGGDTLVGMGGADRLEGEAGDDFLIGANPDGSASGADILVGGAGADFYIVDAGDRVTEFAADDDAVVFQTAHPVGRTMIHVNPDGSREIRAYDANFSTFTAATLNSVAANTHFQAEIYNGENGSGVMLSRGAGPLTAFDEISYNGSVALAEADLQFTAMMDFGLNLYAGLLAPKAGPQAAPSNPDDPQRIIEPVTLGLAIGFLAIAIDRKVVNHFGSWGGLHQELGASARIQGLAEAATKILLLGYSPAQRLEVAIEHPQKDWWKLWAEGVKGGAPENGLALTAQVTPAGDTQVGFDILRLAMTNDRLEFQRLIVEAAQEDAAALQAAREGREQPRTDPNGDETLINAGGRNIDAGGGDDGVVYVTFGVRGAPTESTAAPAEGPQGAGDGDNILNGGAGEDTLIYLADTQGVNVQLDLNGSNGRATGAAIGTDTILNFENIWGGSGNDVLRGNNTDNELRGGAGNDHFIQFGTGRDIFDGGRGIDTADFRGNVSVTIDLMDNSRNSAISGIGTLTLISIENLIGTALADNLYGNNGDNLFIDVEWAEGQARTDRQDVVDGRGGNDTVSFADRNGPIHSVSLSAFRTDNQPGGLVIGGLRMTSIENWIGSRFGDYLSGTDDANRIDGGDGDDTLFGHGGDDILIGGNGVDQLDGGNGFDIAVIGGTADLTIDFNVLADNSGTVTWAGERFRSIEGVVGGSGADRLTGGAGDDYLDGSTGRNIINGGGGNDRLFGSGTLNGDAGDDVLNGGTGADTLNGGAGTDTLNGGDGNDLLNGAGGNDTVNGGVGTDTAVYSGDRSAYTITVSGGVTTVAGPDGTDTVSNVERLQFADGLYDATGAPLPINGTSDADVLNGTSGADVINGLDGNDVIDGRAGNDTLNGGAGDDLLNGGVTGLDTLAGGDGNDTVTYAGHGAAVQIYLDTQVTWDGVTIDNLSSIENAIGSAHADYLGGDAGANRLDGGAGNDVLDGGAGDDVLIGGLTGLDHLRGGAGIDQISYAGHATGVQVYLINQHSWDGVTMDFLSSIENVIGSSHADYLAGDAAANRLEGGGGNDVLDGGAGDDVLIGGLTGLDTLRGGEGIDQISYAGHGTGVQVYLNNQHSWDGVTMDFLSSIENVIGSSHVDYMVGDAAANRLEGGGGDDFLDGGAGDDFLDGGASGLDTLRGGAGTDTVSYATSGTGVEIYLDNNISWDGVTIDNLSSIENAVGSAQADYIRGSEAQNLIQGGAGNDQLSGMGGNDVIDGGTGTDIVVLRGLAANYTVSREGLGYRVTDNVAGRDGSDLLTGIETLRFSDGSTVSLAVPAALIPPALPALVRDHTVPGSLVLPRALEDRDASGYNEVLPAVDDSFILPDKFDLPPVMPRLDEDDRDASGPPEVLPAVDDSFILPSKFDLPSVMPTIDEDDRDASAPPEVLPAVDDSFILPSKFDIPLVMPTMDEINPAIAALTEMQHARHLMLALIQESPFNTSVDSLTPIDDWSSVGQTSRATPWD